MVKKIIKNETCSTFDKDTVQCISEQLSNFEQTLDDQFDNKYTFQSELIACKELFGGHPNNSEKNTNKLYKNKTSNFRANYYSLMICLHNQDEIIKFQPKIFFKGF